MIAVDTNILVYAHRQDSQWHEAASRVVLSLAEGGRPWAIPWPCAHEFIATVTHARIYSPPSSLVEAMNQVEIWMESPTLSMIGEAEGYWDELKALAIAGKAVGGVIHDARVAAICCANGVREFLSADRDFGRFPKQKTRNPLV